MEDMLAILSLALEVMGIDEKALALQLNTDEVDPSRGVFLTRECLRRVKDIHSGQGQCQGQVLILHFRANSLTDYALMISERVVRKPGEFA